MPHNHRQPRRGRQAQPQPAAPNPLQGEDPAMIAILDRLIAVEERKQEDAEEFYKVSQRFTMFPTTKFDSLEPCKAYDHWTNFMRYYRYTMDNNVLRRDNYDDFKTVFELSLWGITITWFRGMKDKFQTIAQFKAAFLGRFNRWGQTQKQLTNAWHTLRFDMQKEDLDAIILDVRLLGDVMHMTPEQTLDKFKDSFDSKISAHLLEANDIELAKAKAQQLIYLYRNKYMPTSASTVLLHEHAQPRAILEHQLIEQEAPIQTLNSHTVDSKYDDDDDKTHSDNKSHKFNNRDPQNDNYKKQSPKWHGNNNNCGRSSYRSRGNHPQGRDSSNRPRRDQNYGYQYAPSPRGNFRKRFGQGSWRGRSYTGQTYGRGQITCQNDNSTSGLGHPSY